MYEFVRGPLVWVAFLVLVLGTAYRMVSVFRMAQKEKGVLAYMNGKYGLRSILHWVIPYASRNTRLHPAFTFLSFLFHVCLLVTPLFLLGHVMSWSESWGVSWWTLPEGLSDVMTIAVIAVVIVFALRRIVDPVARYVTSLSDYLVLAVVVAPFVTGLLARYQVADYRTVLTIHIVTGVVWLAAIPFTRLVHMLLFPLSRAYMGSESGFVRHAKDW
ncbi:MAG: TmcC family electron transfer complex membrane anchor subunit [bacterium]